MGQSRRGGRTGPLGGAVVRVAALTGRSPPMLPPTAGRVTRTSSGPSNKVFLERSTAGTDSRAAAAAPGHRE